ncbi:UNVERIFIED_CONTAM: hypothetical protein Sradi_5190400 [Sesamum radiatum]|uniref:Uncharacterized protein n=1 Tax=Sesamum radiatum TaxID=300843 RepID=A0AAW2M6X0_SESRA
MLAKQVWRILSFPDKLLSRVLRARYFPDDKVLSATCGRYPSYTWRSMHAAIGIVYGGFQWRIGSRRSVQVWRDPCLPRPSFRVSSSPTANSLHLRVCDLIDATSREWNHLMVRALFCHDEAESILAIPLSFVDGDDFFI